MVQRRAMISVSNKSGLAEFARELVELGFEIVSTGGTAKNLREHGIPVTYITEVTGFPEILEGRVKTLHPKVHGGILAKRNEAHQAQLAEHAIIPIDLVAVNLYPFQETINKPGVTLAEAIENIDIGGPTMVRAAAKNHEAVIIVVNPDRYQDVAAELKEKGNVGLELRRQLAVEAFAHTGAYDAAIAQYLSKVTTTSGFPPVFTVTGEKAQDLRYGENPHQGASFYRLPGAKGVGAATARQLHGKELSFTNIMDIQAALDIVREFSETAAVIIKHTNPCGVAVAPAQITAYTRAFEADPVSAFGGIVGLNREVDAITAAEMAKIFLEAVIAPGYSQKALSILQAKANIRLLETGPLNTESMVAGYNVKTVGGGFLVQELDAAVENEADWRVVTEKQPSPVEKENLKFAWKIVKHVKSNAIIVAKDGVSLGVGAGQMNRVGSAIIALNQAGVQAKGAVMASDAFFPFPDTVEEAAKAGITAIIQPGGSVRDEESIQMANRLGITMLFTGMRHFKH